MKNSEKSEKLRKKVKNSEKMEKLRKKRKNSEKKRKNSEKEKLPKRVLQKKKLFPSALLRCGFVVVEPPTTSPFGRRCAVGVDPDPPHTIKAPARAMRCCLCSGSCSVDVVVGVTAVVIFNHTPSTEHTCRGFRRLERHLVSHRTLSICADATASKRSHIHIHLLFTRTWSHFQATLTQSLCIQHRAELPKSASHVTVCATRSLVRGLHQTGIPREIDSRVNTLHVEAFVFEHSLIDWTRIQHIEFFWRIQTYFGIISFAQLHLSMAHIRF